MTAAGSAATTQKDRNPPIPPGFSLAIANDLGVLVVDLRIRMKDAEVVTLFGSSERYPLLNLRGVHWLRRRGVSAAPGAVWSGALAG
jgi:hypothetical protein